MPEYIQLPAWFVVEAPARLRLATEEEAVEARIMSGEAALVPDCGDGGVHPEASDG